MELVDHPSRHRLEWAQSVVLGNKLGGAPHGHLPSLKHGIPFAVDRATLLE
jgi:hypothetical protein